VKYSAVFFCALCFCSVASAQSIEVNRTNKTIAVTADESVYADAEIAVVKIACHSFAATKDAAYSANLRLAEAVSAALQKSGIPAGAIESSDVTLDRVDPENNWTPEMKRDRQYKAHQGWTIRMAAASAQSVIDLAVAAGANEVDDPDWQVADEAALQARAGAAALKKARTVAEQMAQGLGTKLGELVYASNRAPARGYGGVLDAQTVEVSAARVPPAKLKLFPKRVKADGIVYAIFAIQ
jgi:uncharacterized protein YggE